MGARCKVLGGKDAKYGMNDYEYDYQLVYIYIYDINIYILLHVYI